MLLVPTYVAASAIEGLGLFAAGPIAAGAPLWRYEPGFDLLIPLDQLETLPEAFRGYLDRYAYESPDFPGRLVLSCDHAKFLNHSDDPNAGGRGLLTHARRAIAAGEEITCDYRECCADWPGFG